ncbi:hypothetical protein Hdeb2414_s0004g00137051 [Helianthus debilis subsp. tardiflorus]
MSTSDRKMTDLTKKLIIPVCVLHQRQHMLEGRIPQLLPAAFTFPVDFYT